MFIMLQDGMEEQVLQIFLNTLEGVYRERAIVDWLCNHKFMFDQKVLPLIKFVEENRIPNAYHVL